MMDRRQALNSLAASAATFAWPVRAQAWPSRPIKLVVPFPAGSSPDIVARIVAEPLAAVLGQSIVIDNRPGAGGNVGTAPMVLRRAQALGVDMPITQAVVQVLEGSTTPAQALEQLMGRGARPENL